MPWFTGGNGSVSINITFAMYPVSGSGRNEKGTGCNAPAVPATVYLLQTLPHATVALRNGKAAKPEDSQETCRIQQTKLPGKEAAVV